jgi:hypothetical protein
MRRRAHTFTGLLLAVNLAVGMAATGSARADDDFENRVTAGSDYAFSRGAAIELAVLDRDTDEYVDNGEAAHQHIGSASVVKVFIAENLLHRRDRGEISLSQDDLDDMVRMLRSSANAPANRFWSTYGANDIVRDVIRRYRLTETGLTSDINFWGYTPITAHDMVVFYRRLLDGRGGLSNASRDFIVEQLRRSTPRSPEGDWQFFGLHDGLPREPVIAQKQGWMCCLGGGIYRHSTGAVGPEARYIVVALSEGPSSVGAADIERSLTGAVQHMFPEGLIPRGDDATGGTRYGPGGASEGTSASGTGPSVPPPAGDDVVRAARRLPGGPARGTVVVSAGDLGELRGELQGECAHDGAATTITGTVSTDRLTVSFDGSGARLELTGGGLTQSVQLAAGGYQADPSRLVVNTQLLGGGAVTGTLSLDVVCARAAG